MNNEDVKRKRLEEIEFKKKRLEEMRKLRSGASESKPDPKDEISISISSVSSIPTSNVHHPSISSYQPEVLSSIQESPSIPKVGRIKFFGYARNEAILISSRESIQYHQSIQTEDDLSEANVPLSPVKTGGISLQSSVPEIVEPSYLSDNLSANFMPKKYSEIELNSIIQSQRFNEFLRTSSLYVERELEYLGTFNNMKDYQPRNSSDLSILDRKLCRIVDSYEDESFSSRPVLYYATHGQLFLTCHGKPSSTKGSKAAVDESSLESDQFGLVCVWSKDLHKRCEMKFLSSSVVIVALFVVEQNAVLGGCENGQVLMWEMNPLKPYAIQKSSQIGKGHKYPVVCMAMISNNILLTISCDGTLCQWDIARLSEPTHLSMIILPTVSSGSVRDQSFLFSPQSDKFYSFHGPTISAMATGLIDSRCYAFLGTGTGQIVRINLPHRPSDSSQIQIDAHSGLITALHLHNTASRLRIQSLLLSSSLDWSVKLWESAGETLLPILEFSNPIYDYVCDVQWSPVVPSIFLTITSNGQLSIWNLTKSVTEPIETVHVPTETELKHGRVVLNKATWNLDSDLIFVGDSLGITHSLKVHASVLNISANEEIKLLNVLNNFSSRESTRNVENM